MGDDGRTVSTSNKGGTDWDQRCRTSKWSHMDYWTLIEYLYQEENGVLV